MLDETKNAACELSEKLKQRLRIILERIKARKFI
jgi:hypothetical protein